MDTKTTDAGRLKPHLGVRKIEAADLFRDQREITIAHRGVNYRLRITRNDKLILTK